MDRLPVDAIGIYYEFLWFSSLQKSIYDFMTLPSWSDDKIAKKSHHLSLPLLERVLSHTTAPAMEGDIISLPTPNEITASLLDSRLINNAPELDQAKGTDEADLADLCNEIEDSLERDEGVSMRVVSAPTSRLGKRLGAPHSIAVVSATIPCVVASGCVRKSRDEVMRRQIDPLDCLARSALARDAEYDQILDDDFGIATRGEEIDLTLFPLAPAPYHMPYTYEGVSSPLYSREEWNEPHASESSLLCKDIFKDLNVCRKALDETITSAKLRTTESLLPLELSNRVSVHSALLEKFDQKKGAIRLLRSEVTSLDDKIEKLQGDYDALGQENRNLCSQRDVASEEVKRSQSQLTDAKAASAGLTEELTRTDAKLSEQALTVRDLQNELALEKSKSREYKDALDGLREEVSQFVGSVMEGVVRKGMRIGRTDAEFEEAVQQVSNFHVGAKANFDKALVDFLSTPFPFLSKIIVASEGTLSNVVQILPDKIAHSATLISVVPSNVNEDPERVPL
uniref:Transposase (Putative), gypsy type n=1 Tax=Tanacetum cinerariifolium TaxID=118510 RepID=A0A6L2J8Z3_TANCI|nr:hypothetical protein [Tanacetum cinerariifolium]